MKIKMKVIVRYKPGSVSRASLEERLVDILYKACGEGLFTGRTDAEVTSWSAHIIKADKITQKRVGPLSPDELSEDRELVAAALESQEKPE